MIFLPPFFLTITERPLTNPNQDDHFLSILILLLFDPPICTHMFLRWVDCESVQWLKTTGGICFRTVEGGSSLFCNAH